MNLPVPTGNQAIRGKCHEWRELIRHMEPGGCEDLTPKNVYLAQREILKVAKQIGIKVKTRKTAGGGLIVWRVK